MEEKKGGDRSVGYVYLLFLFRRRSNAILAQLAGFTDVFTFFCAGKHLRSVASSSTSVVSSKADAVAAVSINGVYSPAEKGNRVAIRMKCSFFSLVAPKIKEQGW